MPQRVTANVSPQDSDRLDQPNSVCADALDNASARPCDVNFGNIIEVRANKLGDNGS